MSLPRLARRAIIFASLLIASCTSGKEAPRMVAPVLATADARDTQSYARPEVARVTHVALDLAADFAAKRMAGTATLDVQAAPGAGEIVLDTKGLEIQSVTDGGGRPLQYRRGAADGGAGGCCSGEDRLSDRAGRGGAAVAGA
jgi:leukotriene-A4 hydrolase